MKDILQTGTQTMAGACSFYCRWRNRVVRSCGREGGPSACPLSRECPADILLEPLPRAPHLISP